MLLKGLRVSDVIPSESGDQPMIHPDEFETGAQSWMTVTVRELAQLIHPVLSLVSRTAVADLPAIQDGATAADADLQSPLYRTAAISHEWLASLDEPLNFDVESFLIQLHGLADSYGAQMSRALLELVSDTAESHGQIIDAAGMDLFDGVIAAVERLELAFDEDGNHAGAVVMHPDMLKKLEENKPTAEQEARMAEVLARKRREWDAARSRRDLP